MGANASGLWHRGHASPGAGSTLPTRTDQGMPCMGLPASDHLAPSLSHWCGDAPEESHRSGSGGAVYHNGNARLPGVTSTHVEIAPAVYPLPDCSTHRAVTSRKHAVLSGKMRTTCVRRLISSSSRSSRSSCGCGHDVPMRTPDISLLAPWRFDFFRSSRHKAAGRVTVNALPTPGALSSEIVPSISSTSCFVRARPRPVPC